ncbi:MAG: hypothetical protein JOZ51_05330 [Chloroflexi bacterium]|nr:hypothetical protein [Chloroflexota bacterium]
MVFRPHLRSLGLTPSRPLVSALILGLTLSATALRAVQPQGVQAQASPAPDLGDAPDSNNNFGIAMTYGPPAPPAQFPTVFWGANPATGPKHFNSPLLYYLGNSTTGGTITCENQADVGADCDGVNNIVPNTNTADQDKGDDGPVWASMGGITACQPKQYRYFVTVTSGGPYTAYVNSWYDFNQSGNWGQIFGCGSLTVDEWIVKNQAINLPGPGVYVFSTPVFNAAPNPATYPRWARITLSDTPLSPNSPDARRGSGQINGWKLGETEDYRLQY